ncbi:type III secretion system outer membrane ring subunit SctC [Iodobacter fluviatilis]|uniref:Type 3 secretion system secretin n=1 Tax=Iodobacter fluviatilis TaxID=537 RepID=A0A377Q5Y7_9NEIS|nr:type III secretion system outer membrane ring subunit SctC [Iodobacter fluviatilis]TCU81122.1 type III secretion protein C [Iodobacter fluviatilis]STQ90130.1 type III secretion system outer membrane pore InvG [Iodobacter fluviatilis]
MNKFKVFSIAFLLCVMTLESQADPLVSKVQDSRGRIGYVSKNESVQLLLNALAADIKKPFILSPKAMKKTVTGEFDFSQPVQLLHKISNQVGLIWYDDGASYYVYDNSEVKNAVLSLRNASLNNLSEFMRRTGLLDKRYPIRGDAKSNTFYISGPPVYVDLVANAAGYLDDLYKNVDLNKQKIELIRLHNTFVNDRSFDLRSEKVTLPGIASVVGLMLAADGAELIEHPREKPPVGVEAAPLIAAGQTLDGKTFNTSQGQVKIAAYAETNSLLVKGTREQVDIIHGLITQLDVPKRHIELSLWIIDISKSNLDQLGVNWQGAINLGNQVEVALNAGNMQLTGGNTSVLDGAKFVASIMALSQKGQAQIVSRPIVLTQENVPAIFDNNSTFYTKLESERAVALESVTYGTLINVLPRFSEEGEEVEMILNIEDGSAASPSSNGLNNVNGMPVITRTKINTVARVPKDKSLLIGGYSLEHYTKTESKVPLLGDLPWVGGAFRSTKEDVKKMVRVFLIQPRPLDTGSTWNARQFIAPSVLFPDAALDEVVQLLRQSVGDKYGGH